MASHLALPRSSDEPDVSALDLPIDHEAGVTLEVDPFAGGGYGLDPEAAPRADSPEGPSRGAEPSPPPALEPTVATPPAPESATEPVAGASGPGPAPAAADQPAGPRLVRARKRARRRWDAPAWVVSAVIHVLILGGLALVATSSGEVVRRLANLDSALVDNHGPKEETPILNDPADVARDQAVGDLNAASPSMQYNSAGGTAGALILKATGRAMGERNALPTVGTVAAPSSLSMTAVNPTRDLASGGLIGGDVTNAVGEVGDALDQIAREILRHLAQHRLTVVWMFDESESMRDDQKAIKA